MTPTVQQSANTANAIVQRGASCNFIAGTITAALNGNAATTSELQIARTISLTGDVTGTAIFDGSNNISIASTVTAGMPLGFNTPPDGCLGLQGALVSRTAYPELWAWVQANAPLITESAWQAQAAVQSSVGAYSNGDGSTNFRLPKIADFVSGTDMGRVAGTWRASQNKAYNHPVYVATDDAPSAGIGAGHRLAFDFSNPNASNGPFMLSSLALGPEGGTESRPASRPSA